MDRHNQTHNDIKPQNFLVKFKNYQNDLSQIEIVLTDFGMADSDSKGGTPVFASPECFEKKNKTSDIFSFGRVISFLLLTKNQFTNFLFVPIKKQANVKSLKNLVLHGKISISPESKTRKLISRVRTFFTGPDEQCLNLVSQMISLSNRINIQSARKLFDHLRRNSRVKLSHNLITVMQSIITDEVSNDIDAYISELCDLR